MTYEEAITKLEIMMYEMDPFDEEINEALDIAINELKKLVINIEKMKQEKFDEKMKGWYRWI